MVVLSIMGHPKSNSNSFQHRVPSLGIKGYDEFPTLTLDTQWDMWQILSIV